MTSNLVLYDIPSRAPRQCWSPNTWKTRMALNYKGLRYSTSWVEYPDIEPTLKSFGIPTNPPGYMPYTCPALRFDSDTIIMDSTKIVAELEKRFPDKPLHLGSPMQARVAEALGKAGKPLRPFWMTGTYAGVLTDASKPYFKRTREEDLDVSIEELRGTIDFEEEWKKSGVGLHELARLYEDSGDGPFFEGEKFTYTDIIFASMVRFWQMADEKLIFDRVMTSYPIFKRHYKACQPWLERDDE